MVSVVSGSRLGVVNTSRSVVGGGGEWGQTAQGRAGEQVTVNAASGNLVIQNQDARLIGVGADLSLLRTYNSQGSWDGDNADAWRLGYYRRLSGLIGTLNTHGSTLTRTDADGFEATYTWRDGRYVSTDGAGAYDTLTLNGSTATWTDGDTGLTESYQVTANGDYRLTQITDPDGHQVRVGYDAQGLIASLSTWTAGAIRADDTLTLVYDSNRRLQQIDSRTRAADGSELTQTRTLYRYDDAGRLARVTTDLSPEDRSVADGQVYTVAYTYDGVGRLRTLTQTDGSALTIDYDDVGRVRLVTDALGHSTSFTYDVAAGQTTVTDALGQVARLAYDASGRLGQLSGTGHSTRFSYDADGNLATRTNGLGQTTRFDYDNHGNLIRRTDASGQVLTRSYDDANRPTSETVYAQPDQAQTTRYIYDTTGDLRRLRFSVSAEGRVTEQQYNALGQVITTLAYTSGLYGGSATLADLSSWASQQAGMRNTEYRYDLRGQLASRSDASGLTRFTYDPFGRLLQSIDANGGTTAYTYDGLDRLLLSTDALGATTVYAYDDAGYRTSVTAANGLRTVSTYSPVGLLIAQTQYSGNTALGETRYSYDAANRLRMTQDPAGPRQWRLYDEAGRVVGEVNALGHLTETVYDAAGRIAQTIGYDTAVSTAALVDAQGQPINVSLPAIRPTASALDRRQWQLYDVAGLPTHQVNSLGDVTETQYDGAGRVSQVIQHGQRLATLPNGNALPTLTYATAGDPDRVTRNLYDADGLLRGTLDPEGSLTELRYDAAGRLIERIAYATASPTSALATGTLAPLLPATSTDDRHTLWWYDAQGRVIAERNADGTFTEHRYDTAGQRSQTLRYARSATTASPGTDPTSLRPTASPQDQLTRWTYDALNRVQTETADGTVTQYSYDQVGNLIRTDRALGTDELVSRLQRFDLQGRVTAELSANGAALLSSAQTPAQIDAIWAAHATQHTYDAAGRRIRSTDARGSTTVYYFDAAGRLAYTLLKTEQGGEVQASSYTGFGEVARSIRYTRRLSLQDTAPLTGGLADTALDQKIAALADSRDARSQIIYNQRGLIQQAIDALGFQTDYRYDAFGQLSRTEADASASTRLRTDYTHDRRGLLTATTQDPLGLQVQTRSEYDAFGRLTATVDASGHRSTTQYLQADGSPDNGRQVVLTDATGARRTTTYDAFERVIRQTDALGHRTTFSHDTAHRRVTMTTAEGIVTVTESTHLGQVARVTDGTGATTTYRYDKNGNLLSRTDALGHTTQNTYDAADHQITQIEAGTLIRHSYDAANRVLSRTVDPDGLNLRTTYTYDGQGRAVQVTDAAGTLTTYRFDAQGALTETVVDDTTTGLKLTTTTTHDAQGRTLSVTQGAGTPAAQTTAYRYDLLGRRTQQTVDPAGLRLTTQYAYDGAGNLAQVTDPAGHVTRYLYDAEHRLRDTLDAEYGLSETVYDAAGRITQTIRYAERQRGITTVALNNGTLAHSLETLTHSPARDRITRYAYDADGRQTLSVDALGAVTETQYDAAGRVTRTTQYAQAIQLPADGANDQKAVSVHGDYGYVTGANFAAIDTRKTYLVRVRLRQLSGTGTIYAGVVTRDNEGRTLANPYSGTYAYAAAPGVSLTPEMGWVSYEGTLTGENPLDAAASRNKFFAGSQSATPLLLYNYYGSNADPDRLIEIDSLELIDLATGAVLNTSADMSAGAASLTVNHGTVVGAYAGTEAVLSAQDIQARLRPDASRDRVTRYAYDAAGRQTLSVDALGAVTETQYDAAGRVTRTTQYAQPIQWPADGASDHKTVSVNGDYGYVTGANFAAIDTRKTYLVRVRLRQLSGTGTIYAGVVTRDNAGRTLANPYSGTYAYAAAPGVSLTPEMGWVSYEGTLTGENPLDAAASRNKFFAGSTSATPLLLYNYYGSNADPDRLIEIDSLELIDLATGAVLNLGADMSAGAASLTVNHGTVVGAYADTHAALSAQDIQARLRPDASRDRTTRIVYDTAGRQTYTLNAAGSVTQFEYDAAGHVVAQRELANPLNSSSQVDSQAQLATFLPTLRDSARDRGALYVYDAAGRQTHIINAVGSVTQFEYDAAGHVVAQRELANPLNSSSQVDSQAQLATFLPTLQDPARDRVTRTVYDAAGRPVQQLDAERYLTTHSYDAIGNLLATAKYASRVQRVEALADSLPVTILRSGDPIPATGAYLIEDPTQTARSTYEYTALNQRRCSVDAQGYAESSTFDALGHGVSRTNKLGGTAVFEYDALGRLLQETLPVQARRADGSLAAVVNRYRYDSFGNRIQTEEAVGLPEQRTTQYRFDALNRLVQTIGMVYTAVDASGTSRTVVPVDVNRYDAWGRLVVQVRQANLVDGLPVGGRQSRAWYDALDRKTAEVSADGVLAEFSYDAVGNLVRQTIHATPLSPLPTRIDGPPPTVAASTDDRTLRYTYDALGRRLQIWLDGVPSWEAGQPTLDSPQTVRQETLRYDAAGHVVQRTDARGNPSFSYYDALGRQVLAIDAAGYAIAWDYAGAGSVATQETRYARAVPVRDDASRGSYAEAQTLRSALTALGEDPNERNRVTVFVLDRLNRIISRQVQNVAYEHVQADGSRIAQVSSAVTQYTYDGLGHVTQTQERVAAGLDGGTDHLTGVWQTTDIAYDRLGRETTRQAPHYADATGQTVRPRTDTEYDGLGQRQRTLQRGKDDSTEADDRLTRYTYDANGQVIQITDAEGGIVRNSYDADGELSRQTRVAVRRSDGSTRDLVKTWRYDTAGRVIATLDLDTGDSRQTRYTAFGEVAAQGQNNGWQEWAQYTTLGKVWKTNSGDGAVKIYLQDRNGNTTQEIRAGVGDDGSGSSRDLRNVTLAEASVDASLLHKVSVYDVRNLLVRTIEPNINRLGSTVTLSEQFTQNWMPQWGDLNVATTAGKVYAGSGVTGGAAYSTLTTSAGQLSALQGGIPSTVVNGSTLSAHNSTPLTAGSIARFSALDFSPVNSAVTSNSPVDVGTNFYIPSNWPAGTYRVTDTIGTRVSVTMVAAGGSVTLGAYFLGEHRVDIEWNVPNVSTAVKVASFFFTKEAEIQPPFSFAQFSSFGATQSATQLFLDKSGANSDWKGATSFVMLVDPDKPGQALSVTPKNLPDGRLVSFDLATLAATTGTRQIQILGLDGNGHVVAAHKYQLTGNASTGLADAAGDATWYASADGAAWVTNSRQTTGTLNTAQLNWDLGAAAAGSGTLRWRATGAAATATTWRGANITAPNGVGAFVFGTGATALADGSYEFLIEQAGVLRAGSFTVTGGMLVVADTRLRALTLPDEIVTITGPAADALGRGRVALTLSGTTYTAVTDANGRASFNLSQIRRDLGLDRWSVSTTSFHYQGYIDYGNGSRDVRQADRGTLSWRAPRLDGGNSFEFSVDALTEVRPEALLTLPGMASGSLQLTPVSRPSTTLTLGGDDWRLTPNGNQWTVNLGPWRPDWDGADQLIDWRFTGTDGQIVTGRWRVDYLGGVKTESQPVAVTTNRPEVTITPPPGAIQVVLEARIAGSGGAYTHLEDRTAPFVFSVVAWQPAAGAPASTVLEYVQTAFDANGNLIGKSVGTIAVAATGATTHTPGATQLQPARMTLKPPAGSSTVALTMILENGQIVALNPLRTEAGNWVYDLQAYVPTGERRSLSYIYETRDASGKMLTRGSGTLTIAADGGTEGSATEETRAVTVAFRIDGRSLSKAQLRLANGDTVTLTGTWVPPVRPTNDDGTPSTVPGELGYTRFAWDAWKYGQSSATQVLDYSLIPLDANNAPLCDERGQPLLQTGRIYLDPNNSSQPVQLKQQVAVLNLGADITVARSQAYNAFGEVIEERDDGVADRMRAQLGRALTADEQAAARTTLRYNTLGQLIAKIDPQTHITLANGYVDRDRPTTRYGHDLLGRQTTQTDANGHLTRQTWLAGTQTLTRQWQADGGVRRTDYDVFGDARQITDAENHVTQQNFDKLGRLVQVDRLGIQRVDSAGTLQAATPLTERYSYDQLGQRLSRTDALGQTTRTDYDGQGRITATVSAAGFTTAYRWESATVGSLNGQTATGSQLTTVQADGRALIDRIDYFGHTTWHRDLAGTQYTYHYDAAARLISQTSTAHTGQDQGQHIRYTYYANGDIQSATDEAAHTRSEYGYDNAGNRVSEAYYQWDGGTRIASYQNATITYDELNRVTRVQDLNYFDIRYEYDAVGNRRLVDSVYWDGVAGLRNRQTYWYAYDPMNRFTVTKGTLGGSLSGSINGARAASKADDSIHVMAGPEGTTLGYDRIGQRRVAEYTYNGSLVHETYSYSQDGYLQTMAQNATLKDVRVLDALGRTLAQYDTQNQTQTVSHYDADNRLLSQRFTSAKDSTKNNTTAYSYYTDLSNTLTSQTGSGALATVVTSPDSGNATTTTYQYDYWDDAKQKRLTISTSGRADGTTTLSYNANGHLTRAYDAAAALTTTYFNSANGLILKRERQQGTGTNNTAKVGSHFYYYVDGKRVGDVSDDPNDDPRLSYAEALARKAQTLQDKKDLYKNFKPVTSADFDQNYEPINDHYPGAVGGTYTVRGGETLQSVAQTLWGDSSQWYLIAEVNGLQGPEGLTQGQVLVIPNKVVNVHNNSGTVRPYSAGEAIGNIDPTLPAPPPPPKEGCGTLGAILVIVVAVAVTVVTGGALAATLGPVVSGALGAAAGSIASQGVGIAIGQQQGFSWKAVGQAAMAGGISGGLGANGLDAGGSAFGAGTWQAAATNAVLSSGANMALHGDWSWRQVVASAASAGVGGDPTRIGGSGLNWSDATAVGGRFAGNWVSNRIVQRESHTHQAWVQTIGQAMGNVVGDQIVEGLQPQGAYAQGYRNGADIDSDNYVAPQAGNGLRLGAEGLGLRVDADTSSAWTNEVNAGIYDRALELASLDRPLPGELDPVFAADAVRRLQEAASGAPLADPGDPSHVLGYMDAGARFDTRLPIAGPSSRTKPDGSPATYTFDRATGEVYWNFGKENTVRAIPLAYKHPKWEEALNDPSNVWVQGPRIGAVLADFGVLTASSVAGMTTGGWAFAAMRGVGYGLLSAGAGAGVVGDLTAQASDNLAWLASDGQLGRSGLSGTELAVSAGLGALPGLPSAVRNWADDLRGLGLPDWNIRLATRQSGMLYANPLPFELTAYESGQGLRLPRVDFDTVDALAPGFYRANPQQLRFMQPTVSPNYSVGGHTIASTADDLRLGRVTPEKLGNPLRVVMVDGKPFSFDNRRLLSYSLADVREAPIQVMRLDDPMFARQVRTRFNSIEGEGLRVVVVLSSERKATMANLYQLGIIQRPR